MVSNALSNDYSRFPAPIRLMAAYWPHGHVARTDLLKFSGGLYDGRSAANMDSLGQGIAGAFRVGRKVAYPVLDVCEFLAGKFSQVIPKQRTPANNDPTDNINSAPSL